MRFVTTLILAIAATTLFAQEVQVMGNIESNTTWTKNNVYVLTEGFHYVINNATLTVEAGTVVKGDAGTLVVTKGCKLIAVGTPTQPIVFTSYQAAGNRAAGDWGGIVICGQAPINVPGGTNVVEGGLDTGLGQYGGTIADDNSGHLEYVRIEYAGKFYIPNNELNSLTLAGIGSGTVIDHVEVSNGLDDGFEWFGGNVNGKYLVSHAMLDDDFDTDFGFSGHVQYGVVLRDPSKADVSGSNGFESDNDGTGSVNEPFTDGKFSNITVFGPMQGNGNTINENYRRGLHIRRSSKLDVYNSVILGYPTGLRIENANTGAFAQSGDLNVRNCLFAGCTLNFEATSTPADFDILAWSALMYNTTVATPTLAGYTDPYSAAPNFRAAADAPVLAGADFSGINNIFETTTHIGAFNEDKPWTDCWAEFDPQNQVYNGAINYLTGSISPIGEQTVGVTLTATSSNSDDAYQWWRDGAMIDGATNATIIADIAGTYVCQITSARGCQLVSEPAAVGVSATENSGIESLRLAPNPTNDVLQVRFNALAADLLQLQVADITGKVRISTLMTPSGDGLQTTLNVSELPAGVYVLTLRNQNGISNSKFVKQ